MHREIEITIDKDGVTEIDLKGFHGKGCADITDALTKVLGKVIQRDKKCEYYQAEVQEKTKQTQRI